jgi:hypothetical protein
MRYGNAENGVSIFSCHFQHTHCKTKIYLYTIYTNEVLAMCTFHMTMFSFFPLKSYFTFEVILFV